MKSAKKEFRLQPPITAFIADSHGKNIYIQNPFFNNKLKITVVLDMLPCSVVERY